MISEYPQLRLALFVGVLALMFLIESKFPARSWTDGRKQRLKYSVGLMLVNNVTMRLLVAGPFIAFTAWVQKEGFGLTHLIGITGLWEVVLTVIVFDFLDALKHKWFHRVPFMWRFHRVHHTDKSLDILTALRYHPGEMIISAIIKAGWIFIWGPSVLAFTAFEIVLNMASEFHHSNIGLGKWEPLLNKVLVTPRYHAIHHTINREIGDQNFTTIFSIWDKLLGSFTDPMTTSINLERLPMMQKNHLSLWDTLKAPLVSPRKNGSERFEEESKTQHDYLEKLFDCAYKKFSTHKAILVDVREDDERAKEGSLSIAQNFPFSQLNSSGIDEIATLAKNREIYLFCKAGIRSGHIVDKLKARNLNAYNLGGYQDCIEHNFN